MIDYISSDEKSLIQEMILDGQERMFQPIEAPEPYCFVTFKMHPRYVTHLGVVMEDKDQFVHCIQKKNVCRERLSNPIWARRIDGFYRYVRN